MYMTKQPHSPLSFFGPKSRHQFSLHTFVGRWPATFIHVTHTPRVHWLRIELLNPPAWLGSIENSKCFSVIKYAQIFVCALINKKLWNEVFGGWICWIWWLATLNFRCTPCWLFAVDVRECFTWFACRFFKAEMLELRWAGSTRRCWLIVACHAKAS